MGLPWSLGQMGDEMRTDSDIKGELGHTLEYGLRMDGMGIAVTVSAGLVSYAAASTACARSSERETLRSGVLG